MQPPPSSPHNASSMPTMIAADVYLEQVPLPDGTPEEMAKAFCDVVNEAYTEDRTGLSKLHGVPMAVRLYDAWKLELKGKSFVVLQWNTYSMPDEEQE